MIDDPCKLTIQLTRALNENQATSCGVAVLTSDKVTSGRAVENR